MLLLEEGIQQRKLNMPEHDLSEFTEFHDAKIGAGVKFSHKVKKGMLRGNDKQWICKEVEKPTGARLEALAQEFIRLIIPHQPETRIARDTLTGTYHVLSEEVAGYLNLPTGQQQQFTNGQYPGLGQAMVCSMLLQEIDLKNGNIGLDKYERVIKIDGDWCFAELQDYGGQYQLNEAAIANLPAPVGFTSYNWLDLVYEGRARPSSNIVNAAQLSNAPHFRAEVNQALLKICLIPDEYIEKFVDAYMPAGGERFLTLIKSRLSKLKQAAFTNPSFLEYLNSKHAVADTEAMTNQLMDFNVVGSPLLSKAEKERIRAMIPIPESVQATKRTLEDAASAKQVNMASELSERYGLHDLITRLELLSKHYQDENVNRHFLSLKNHIEEQLTNWECIVNCKGVTDEVVDNAVTELNRSIDAKFEEVLSQESIREHKNPIVKAWNMFKAFLNQKLGHAFFDIGKTGREQKIIEARTVLKTKFFNIKEKYQEINEAEPAASQETSLGPP